MSRLGAVRALPSEQPLNHDRIKLVQGYLAHKKMPSHSEISQGPRRGPTAGSYGEEFPNARGTPVLSAERGEVETDCRGFLKTRPRDVSAYGTHLPMSQGQPYEGRPASLGHHCTTEVFF